MKTTTKLGQTLRRKREQLEFGTKEVAEKVGITPNYYSMIECGQPTHVSDKLLEKICKVLQIKSNLSSAQEAHNDRNRRYERARRDAAKEL